ncbi:MAG: hypothetical protein LH654_04920 [Thermoleophilia bacterium]|nr:hypothetical protein [Thermoleophilia bacterium]
MTSDSGTPHAIESKLEAVDEYQAPPRGQEQDTGDEPDEQRDDDQTVDINLLDAQGGKPVLETSKLPRVAPADATYTISGRDELATEPGAPPPGKTM